MPTAAIAFGNQQATGDSPLAGAPSTAYNVVTDGPGAVRRRPGIVEWTPWEEAYAANPYSNTSLYSFITDISVTGISSFNGAPVWVAGRTNVVPNRPYNHWWTIDSDGDLDELSAASALTMVVGTERPQFAQTQFRLVVVAGGAVDVGMVGTRYDANGTVDAVNGSYLSTHIAALAQRLMVNDTTSTSTLNRVHYTGAGSTGNLTFGALGFTSAEARPDSVVALYENTNELFVFGQTTLQVFVPDAQVILAPQRTVNRGCSAPYSVIRANEHFGWLDEERQIVVSDGRDLDEVSAPIAGTLDGIATVDDCYGFRVNADQFDLMCWQFPTDGRTFCYQRGGGWSQWSTQTDENTHGPFSITSHYYWPEENTHLVGREDGSIAQLSTSAYTDLGDPIVAEVTTGFYNHGTDAVKFTDALHLTFKRGHATGSTEPQVFLSWRDAQGAAFSPPMRIGLGTTGDYVSTVTLRTLGPYRRRQWRLTFSDETEFVLAGVTEDFSIGGN